MARSRQGLEGKYWDLPVLQKHYHAEPLEHLLVRLLTGEMQLREGGWDLPPPCQYPDAPADGSRFRADQGR